MKKFLNHVDEHAIEYGSLPFWSWNDKLDPKELRRQINVMKDLQMNGFFMHARAGLETEYLSDEWYECINACIDEAEKLGMEAWSYDENGFPSGFGGGKVLEDRANWATYIVHEISKEFPTESNQDKVLLAVYVMKDNKISRVTEACDAYEYIAVYQKFDPSYVDTTDAEITKKFIEVTHEDYKKHIDASSFGKSMPGFFTDEPEYYRYGTPWSNKFADEFQKAYGYDVFSGLAYMFIDAEGAKEFRYDYYLLLHNLFIKNWIKVVYDWCKENDCLLTGHAIEETGLFLQMWCCGGLMTFYEYQDIPGIDYLSRNINHDIAGKQIGSVAAQLGKKKVLSEMFACCGWDVTPMELKSIAELQYAAGVNVMCQHLYGYSMRGQRKRDYPANYSEHLPWQGAMKEFNEYFNRLGLVLSLGSERVNTLIIHPMHSAYLDYKRKEDVESIRPLEESFINITNYFSAHQIPYHYGDEELMAKYGSIVGNKLKIGLCEYEYVVLPTMYTIDSATAELLKEFIAAGGKIYLHGDAPTRIDGRCSDLSWLKSNIGFGDVYANAYVNIKNEGQICDGLKQMCRDTEYGKIYYIANVTQNQYLDCEVIFRGCKNVKEIRLQSDEWEKNPVIDLETYSSDGSAAVSTSFSASESRIFIETDEPVTKTKDDIVKEYSAEVMTVDNFTLVKNSENAITLDNAQISYDGTNYEKTRSVLLIADMLIKRKYTGPVYLKFKYNVEKLPESLNVAVEPMKNMKVSVNGNELSYDEGFWFDRSFKRADILKYTKVGENEIVMSFDYYQQDIVYETLYGDVMESLRNCLAIDTEIESIYLFGDFAVKTDKKFTPDERRSFCYDGDFAITTKKDDLNLSNIVVDGFPFFAGCIEAQTEFDFDGTNCTVALDGRFSYADVYVNDNFVKRLIFEYECDVTEYVKKGKNTLKIGLCNSNRNLLGPHHFADPEPYACGPNTFSLETMWTDDETCELYRERYAFVRFGTDVKIITE
ncbi:MAG: hypothetical protein IJZ94_03140 [Clostridia bacterium]|nr:hypothetical protein [Clostridia bacterium]